MGRSNVRFLLLGLVLGIVVSQAWPWVTARSWSVWRAGSSRPAASPVTPLSSNISVQNKAVVALTRVLPDDPARATVQDGASFYTLGFQGKGTDATARVKVKAFVSATEPNVAVVAVFRSGQPTPVALVSKPVAGNQRESIDVSAEIPGAGSTPLYLDFRIGPGRAGTIVFNGPEGASSPVATEIRVTE